MAIADSIQNLRFISETAVRAYDALVQKGLWPRARRTQSPLGALALVGLGAAVGAGVALALAPSTGSDLRSSLGETLRKLGNDWLGGLGITPQVSPQGARAETVEAKDAEPSESVSTDNHKNGVGRRKQAHHGTSRASLAKGPPGPPPRRRGRAHLRPTTFCTSSMARRSARTLCMPLSTKSKPYDRCRATAKSGASRYESTPRREPQP